MSLDPALRSRIESLLQSNRVVLFMKGQPTMPQCGFSAKAVGALSALVTPFMIFPPMVPIFRSCGPPAWSAARPP